MGTRRVGVVLTVLAVALSMAVPGSADEHWAEVLVVELGPDSEAICGVGFEDGLGSGEDPFYRHETCQRESYRSKVSAWENDDPSGEWKLVQHATLGDEKLAEWEEAGGPKGYATGCLVNVGFLVEYGFFSGYEWLFVDGIRRFNPQGRMNEVCRLELPDEQVNLFLEAPVAGQPFYVAHGYADEPTPFPTVGDDPWFTLQVDGVEVEHDAQGILPGTRVRWFYAFPEGLDAGTVLTGTWEDIGYGELMKEVVVSSS